MKHTRDAFPWPAITGSSTPTRWTALRKPKRRGSPAKSGSKERKRSFGVLEVGVQPGGNRAFYSPQADTVYMPPFEAFTEPLFYYSVLSHETTHWTAPPHRLNRDLSGRFGSENYAMEELIAELGAAFLCAELGLPTDPRADHAPYISSWLKALRNDKRAIFTAAAKAQEAVDWMAKRAEVEVAA